MYLRPKHVRGRYNTRLTGPKRPQRTLTAGARPSLKGRLASVAVHTPPALAHASPCPRLLLGSSLSPTRMPTNASEPVREHGDGVRRGWRVRSHQKWLRKWWWCAARASHGPRPATAGLCQSVGTRSCRTLSSRWRKLCPPIGASFRSSRDSVCAMRGFKSRWYLHSSGEHTVARGR